MLTDGQVHDMPAGDAAAAARELGAPVHALLSGRPDEGDRRLVVAQAPSFGLVGKELQLKVRVEDLPESSPGKQDGAQGQAVVTWRKDGGQPRQVTVPIGRDVPLTLPIDHGGPNILELAVQLTKPASGRRTRPPACPSSSCQYFWCAAALPAGRVFFSASLTGLRLPCTRRASSAFPAKASSVYSCMRRSFLVCSRKGGVEQRYTCQPSSRMLSSQCSSLEVLTMSLSPAMRVSRV